MRQIHQKYLILLIVSFVLSSCEFIILRMLKLDSGGYDLRLMLVPVAAFLFLWVKDIQIKDRPIYLRLRKYSVLIFFSTLIFFEVAIRLSGTKAGAILKYGF